MRHSWVRTGEPEWCDSGVTDFLGVLEKPLSLLAGVFRDSKVPRGNLCAKPHVRKSAPKSTVKTQGSNEPKHSGARRASPAGDAVSHQQGLQQVVRDAFEGGEASRGSRPQGWHMVRGQAATSCISLPFPLSFRIRIFDKGLNCGSQV